jgi:hypothetical protein
MCDTKLKVKKILRFSLDKCNIMIHYAKVGKAEEDRSVLCKFDYFNFFHGLFAPRCNIDQFIF